MSTREHSVQPGRITTPATVVGPSTTDAPTPEQSAADVPARPAPRRPLRRGRKQRTLGELHRRSEERRVGKECGSRWGRDKEKEKGMQCEREWRERKNKCRESERS